MAFNITEITSAINSASGLAKPNMFFVVITPPSSLGLSTYPRQAMFFCDSAQLPGLTFDTSPIKTAGYGGAEMRPTNAAFPAVNATFIVDARGRAIRFFQQWLALLNNWSRERVGVMQGTSLSYGEWNYPETYEGTVEIHAVNPDNNNSEVVVYQLSRAFPVQVGDIAVAWELNDTIMKLPISFAYTSWNTGNVPSTKADSLQTQGVSLLQTGVTPTQAAAFANLT
jgi:hypothetical protein